MKNNSNEFNTLLQQGNALSNLGLYEAAITSYDKAINTKHKAVQLNPDFYLAWYNRGGAFLKIKQYEKAFYSYNKVVQIKPSYYEAWHWRGIILCDHLGRYEEAINSFKKVLEIKPDHHEAWHNQGVAQSNLKQYKEAIIFFEKALEIKPDYHEAWHTLGVSLRELKRYEEAIYSFNKAIAIKPDFYQALDGKGIVLCDLEQYSQALDYFKKSITINPSYYEAWSNQGAALGKIERYEEAINSHDKALEIKPDDHDAWNNRGAVLCGLERYEEAITSYDRALEIKSDYHEAWNNRGNALYDLERYEEAIASYDKAIEIKPNKYEAWNGRGIALYDLERYEEAIDSYDKALAIKPDDHDAWNNRGNALDKLGLHEEAIHSFDKAIEIKLDYHEAWSNRGIAAGNSRGYVPFLHTKELNSELNKRGYPGELASYRAGLEFIHRDKHPEGWGFLHHRIGNAKYFKGRQKAESRLKSSWDYWRQAENSYKTALLTLQPPKFTELYLEVVKDLIRVLLNLKEIQEVQQLQRDGTEVLKRTLANPKRSEYSKRKLALKYASFNQLTVDIKVQSENFVKALTLAEEGKNICLRWLLGIEEIPEIEYSQIQTLLNPTTAIVYWHLSPAALTTFVLLADQPNPILIESATVPAENDQRPASLLQLLDWENWLTAWNDDYTTYSSSKKESGNKDHSWRRKMQNRLDSLRQILNITAIEDTLQNHSIQNLILIPHRDLHRFPLHSLFENYTCSYLPSAYLALQQTPTESQLSKLLIVENPKSQPHLNGNDVSLPFAEVEAALIRQIYRQHTYIEDENDQTQQITCEAVQAALSQSHDIFHFTGHGAYNSLNPAKSCLFLSGTEKLTLLDIKDLDLSSYRLVCLAACETAVTGNQTITDEYVGLVSAFLKAGVTYVVSTLWTVESAATMLFMRQFYQNLQAKQLPPTALKNAQTWLKSATHEDLINSIQDAITQLSEQKALQLALEDEQLRISKLEENQPYSHPYYWAAFTISGLHQ